MKCDLLQAATDLSTFLAGCAVCIFIVDQKKRQEVMPQISLKAMAARKFQQIMKALIK